MESVKDEIQAAISKLGLLENDIRMLTDKLAKEIYYAALRKFVGSGEPRWWWEQFQSYVSVDFPEGDGWKHIAELVPDSVETVWFVVEDISLPFYPVYEARPSVLSAVIGECYGFEFYIMGQEFEWLICENHHDRIFAVGPRAEETAEKFALESGSRISRPGERR